MADARQSDREHMESAIVRFLPNMRAFAIKMTHDVTRADDLVQETILKALANVDKFQAGTNVEAWLFTIMSNGHRSAWRKTKREMPWDPSLADNLRISTEQTDKGGDAADLSKLVKVLASLPAEQRDALTAIGYLQMSYEEASERLSCAIGTIKSRVNRARTRAALLMDDYQVSIDLYPMRVAARAVPASHPYYPIAKALEELCDFVAPEGGQSSETEDEAWSAIIAAGALDLEYDEAAAC